jgi:TRAP transporter TAXI family solute receptor
MSINVRETNASAENFQLLASKSIDLGIAIWDTALDAVKGNGAFKGKAVPEIQTLVIDRLTAHLILVRSDKNINSVYDLEGKAFAPSFQGSGVYDTVKNMLDALGIKTKEFKGNLEDLQNAIADGRIVGYGKSGSGKKADASMVEVSSQTPVKLIGFTESDSAKIIAKYPTYIFDSIPAGTLNNKEPFLTISQYAGYFTTSATAEDTAYRLTKALYTTIQQASTEANNESARGRTPAETVKTNGLLPLHAGSARYFKEIGALK